MVFGYQTAVSPASRQISHGWPVVGNETVILDYRRLSRERPDAARETTVTPRICDPLSPLLVHAADHDFQVLCLRANHTDRMVGRLSPVFEDLNVAASHASNLGKHFLKFGATDKA